MSVEDLTEEDLKDLNINTKEIEELYEYKEYNDKLYGTPYVFGYQGLQRKVKKGNTEENKTLSNFLPIPIKKICKDNGLEEEGDKLYIMSIRNLYTTSKDPIELMTWTDTFKYFERCCDACETAANVVESVIMKNS